MRITAGKFKARSLAAPEDASVRPTSDKVRQAIFNILEHRDFGFAFGLEGARVVDLFAGTGAMGLESLSRGARYCLFVDDSPASRALIRENVEAFGLTGATKIDDAHYDVLQHLEGNFPGGVIDLHYRFTLRGASIAELVIEP